MFRIMLGGDQRERLRLVLERDIEERKLVGTLVFVKDFQRVRIARRHEVGSNGEIVNPGIDGFVGGVREFERRGVDRGWKS